MRVTIFAKTLPFNDKTIDDHPLGGTETGVIRLARALKELGHEVVVLTTDPLPPLTDPLYVPLDAISDLGRVDLFIGVRDWNTVFLPVDARLRMLWTGDSPLQPFTRGLGDKRVVERVDALLTVSEWQLNALCSASGFPTEKGWVIGNGIEPSYFEGKETRVRKRLIYSSTPHRGLQLMPAILEQLIAKHPDLEFHSFSGYQVYKDLVPDEDKRAFERTIAQLSRFTQFHEHGNVTQRALAREMMRSSVLCYPNTFEETSCITVLEAQAAGCGIVTSSLGALPETIGKAGILVEGEPGSLAYISGFVSAVDSLLTDDRLLESLSEMGRKGAPRFYWSTIAARFSDFFVERLGGTHH